MSQIYPSFTFFKKSCKMHCWCSLLFPTHDLFLKYEILPIYSLYNYRLLMIYKRSSHSHEHYISYLAKLEKNTHILQTRHKEIWLVPTPRAYYTEQSLSYTVPVLLNKLNRELFDPFQHSSDVIKRFFLARLRNVALSLNLYLLLFFFVSP